MPALLSGHDLLHPPLPPPLRESTSTWFRSQERAFFSRREPFIPVHIDIDNPIPQDEYKGNITQAIPPPCLPPLTVGLSIL